MTSELNIARWIDAGRLNIWKRHLKLCSSDLDVTDDTVIKKEKLFFNGSSMVDVGRYFITGNAKSNFILNVGRNFIVVIAKGVVKR